MNGSKKTDWLMEGSIPVKIEVAASLPQVGWKSLTVLTGCSAESRMNFSVAELKSDQWTSGRLAGILRADWLTGLVVNNSWRAESVHGRGRERRSPSRASV